MKIISDKKTGHVIGACDDAGFEIVGRKIYSLDDNGERAMRISFNDVDTFEASDVADSEVPENLHEEMHKYEIKDKKLKLKDAK